MEMDLRNTGAKVFAYIMIGMLGLMITNQAVYTHTHKMADGSIVHHAHPYQKSDNPSPFATHHHTHAEFILYENLKILIPFIFFFLAVISVFSHKKFQKDRPEHLLSPHIIYTRDRAPPAL